MKAAAWTALVTLGLAIGATAQQTTDQISFEQADKNKDGRVNRAECTAIAGFDFANADANQDLFLSRPEFAAAMARTASRADGAVGRRSGDRAMTTSRPRG